MPKEDGIGYSQYTPQKLAHFRKIVAMHLRITRAVLKKHEQLYRPYYRYIDLTAGKGFVPNSNLKGSPLVFLEEIESDEVKIKVDPFVKTQFGSKLR